MTISTLSNLLCCALVSTLCILIKAQEIPKLPFCDEDVIRSELIFVSTLDGFITTLTPAGEVAWKVKTGPGSLLTSNIHKLELTNNGQWLRIIPSLSGGLYKFNGITLDPIPLSADSLLSSSFRYSDDLVIAGGKEVRTYGILLNSGKQVYECALEGCKNTTDYYAEEYGDVIVIECKTYTVFAVEPRSGARRWNFSVGEHNIKIPFADCIYRNKKNFDFNVSVVIPEGLLIAKDSRKVPDVLWQHKFESPIVAVWRSNGNEIKKIDLFNSAIVLTKTNTNSPSLYIGMHNKQLYVHESDSLQNMLQLQEISNEKHSVIDSKSLTKIPWKPVPATSTSKDVIIDESDDSTALSVLYASEYVNGNGYYLYTQEKTVCPNNNTISIEKSHMDSSWSRWREAMVISVVTVILCNIAYYYGILGFNFRKKSEHLTLQSSENYKHNRTISHSDSTETICTSRYSTEFEPISCLGKGGFGVVFQAKKKFDECHYAIKRITLPNKPAAKHRMMREVKALAKLDHCNIVRYYNAWLESPPFDWHFLHDQQLLMESSVPFTDKFQDTKSIINKRGLSLAISMESDSFMFTDNFHKPENEDSSSIIFKNSFDSKDNLNCGYTNQESSSVVFLNNSVSPTSLQAASSCKDYKNNCDTPEVIIQNKHPPPTYLYIQMQLCCKESLKDWLYNKQDRNRSEIVNIFGQIVDAVEYVHFRGLIHRDLKPSNIFFSLEGQIKVGDFGLVTGIKEYDVNDEDVLKSSSQPLDSYTNAVGTHLYMSPEQVEGRQYDCKVDIYSLGIIFFELLITFKTEMERYSVLTDLRKNIYPKDFSKEFYKECDLLKLMLAADPAKRPTASEIRLRLS